MEQWTYKWKAINAHVTNETPKRIFLDEVFTSFVCIIVDFVASIRTTYFTEILCTFQNRTNFHKATVFNPLNRIQKWEILTLNHHRFHVVDNFSYLKFAQRQHNIVEAHHCEDKVCVHCVRNHCDVGCLEIRFEVCIARQTDEPKR